MLIVPAYALPMFSLFLFYPEFGVIVKALQCTACSLVGGQVVGIVSCAVRLPLAVT